jgi:flagellar biosynthesis protein FlhF
VLSGLKDIPLVLVDSAGMGQRDRRLREELARLQAASGQLRAYVVLPATARLDTLDETLSALKVSSLAGAVISKLDEATSLGPVLSVLMQYELGAAYLTNGQRVPEDLLKTRGADLVIRAQACGRQRRAATAWNAAGTVRVG